MMSNAYLIEEKNKKINFLLAVEKKLKSDIQNIVDVVR